MTIISMFSGPRNISTTMMRAFENRPDTAVFDEPYYACYLKESGAPHPMRDEIMAAQPNDWGDVRRQLHAAHEGGPAIQFEKHIAFHFGGDGPIDWAKDAKAFHLIRDPRAMIASYNKKYSDIAPIIDSYRVQREIDDFLGAECPVVDATDILKNPEAMLRALCDALGVDFDPAMLSWPAGARDSDGVWAPHWYDAVLASTGFKPYEARETVLDPTLEEAAAKAMDDYEFFHNRRIIVD